MKLLYPAIFTKEGTGFFVVVPDLDGCFSEGNTFEEAYQDTKNAIGLYLDGMEEYPKPSDPLSVKAENGIQFMSVVDFDEEEYKRQNK